MKRLIAPLAALFAFAGPAFAQPTAPPRLTTATAPHVVWIGDSITANANFLTVPPYDNVTNPYKLSEQLIGYPTWTKILTGYRINSQLNADDFGVGGFLTAQALSELPAAIARKPDVCVVHGGRNDAQGAIPALPDNKPGTITNNLKQMYDKLQAENCVVFAIKILSNNSWLNLAAKQNAFQVNQWIEQQKLVRKGFYVIDAGATFDDPTNTTAWAPKANYVEDGTHPSIWGAYVVGLQLANQINALWPGWRLRLQNVDDVYDAANNPTGDLLSFHMFTGAADGTLSGGATGTAAHGWTLDATGKLGATVVGSQTTTTDGRQAQTITISGTANGAGGKVFLIQALNVANLLQGDNIECSIDANWGTTTNISSVELFFKSDEGGQLFYTSVGATGAQNANLGFTLPTNVGGPVASLSVPLYTPRRIIANQPTNSAGASQIIVQISFLTPLAAAAVAGTFQFASPSCRKILPVAAP